MSEVDVREVEDVDEAADVVAELLDETGEDHDQDEEMGLERPMSKARPSETQLVNELSRMRAELQAGFDSKAAVLRWLQKLTVRTLGQVETRRYQQIARSFIPDDSSLEGPLLAAFLTEDARTRSLPDGVAERLRERWAADTIAATQARAFRNHRKDAGEYIGGEENDDIEDFAENPEAFMMRPALRELDQFQQDALDMVLGGLPDRSAILDWGDILMVATRGEPVDSSRGPGAFIPKCYKEDSTVRLLTDTSPPYRRARQAFIARWLPPVFNRAVQDLARRTTEEPEKEQSAGNPSDAPSWES